MEKCIKILNCKAIVIPIDDVDMALDKAFEVLDDVRRLLSCPYIITIISGSLHLYSHMMHVHFQKLAAPIGFIDDDTLKHGRETAQSLAEAYLTKVFPNHQRLSLLPIDDLLPKLQIIEKEQDKGITFFKYEKDLQGYFYYLCNGEAGSTKWPKPKNAREVTQLIRSLPPSIFKEKSEEYLWSTFQSWAELKQDDVAYSNAITYRQFINNEQQLFRIDQLLAFSVNQQIKLKFPGIKKEFLNEQLVATKELSDKEEIENNKILKSVFTDDSLVMRSMPPIEFYVKNLFLSKKNIGTYENHILKLIYTHCDYYGKLNQKIYNIYFSRAYEILILSILDITSKEKKVHWDKQLQFILNSPPFYSIHAMNPTKFVDDEDMFDGKDLKNNYENSSDNNDNNKSIEDFAKEIVAWCEKYKESLKGLQTKNLIPLLHAVFNKVFTQLHIMRKKSFKLNEDEHLSDIAKRFEYLVINAFASFMKDGIIIHAIPSLNATVSTIRDESKFKSSDRILTKNIEELVDFDTKEPKNDSNIASLFLSAIWNHPIFKINFVYIPIVKIGNGISKYQNSNLFIFIKNQVLNYYGDFNYRNIIKWINKVDGELNLTQTLNKLQEDEQYKIFGDEKNILNSNVKGEFPLLYRAIYNWINKK
nr:hypothetical protein [Gilliamella apicola]